MKHRIADACVNRNHVYFFDNEVQALCSLSAENSRVEILAINDKSFFDSYHIFCDRNFLYVMSMQTVDFLKYDMNLRTLDLITNHSAEGKLESPYRYDYHMLLDNQLWSFPNGQEKPIYCYDLETGVFMQNSILCNDQIIRTNHKVFTRFSSAFEDVYWCALNKTNKYIKYDLRKQKIQLYEVSDPTICIDAISFDGEYLWMTSAKDSVIFKCTETGNIIKAFYGDEKSDSDTFSRLYCIKQYVIGLPRFGEYIFFINKHTNKTLKKYLNNINPEIGTYLSGGSKILKCLEYKDKLLFFGFGIDLLIITDLDGNSAFSTQIIYSEKDIIKINYAKIVKNRVIQENEEMYLHNFMEVINEYSFKSGYISNISKLFGKNIIYNYIKKSLI